MYEKIEKVDPEITKLLLEEKNRQINTIQLIASENFTSGAVLAAQGSIATNKYAEGLPKKRYYGGCETIDAIETLAIERAKTLFKADFVNVQPHSGSSANIAVFAALLEPHDTILAMSLDAGGHLTHGHPVNISGKYFNTVHYGINDEGLIDYDEVRELAIKHKPKLIIAGFSAYSQVIDWAIFADIAKECKAYYMVDMAHVAGLVAAGLYPSPIPHADIVTSTTHKTLRGPRGGMILAKKNDALTKKLNKGVFPMTQGGPLMHVIAAKAVCYHEAMQKSFVTYQTQVIRNTQIMAAVFVEEGFKVISGVPKCHMFLLSLEGAGINGHEAQELLESVGIIVNKNSIPNDPLPPNKTSGIRIGSQAMTTRGMNAEQAKKIALWMAGLLKAPKDAKLYQSKVQEVLKKMSTVPDAWGI